MNWCQSYYEVKENTGRWLTEREKRPPDSRRWRLLAWSPWDGVQQNTISSDVTAEATHKLNAAFGKSLECSSASWLGNLQDTGVPLGACTCGWQAITISLRVKWKATDERLQSVLVFSHTGHTIYSMLLVHPIYGHFLLAWLHPGSFRKIQGWTNS